ncbi:MAG: biotin transporter BioY [Acetatifactor sp.]|nr:biotin transporter BioY [Acetatifactor sp.]
MKNFSTKDIVFVGVFAALMAICSWISIPTTVPFTLQTFAVFLAIGVLSGKLGTLAVLIYVILGAIGLPVFANFTGGMGILLGNTGGYIIGFIATALIMWLFETLFGHKTVVLAISSLLGLIACYAIGTAWFMFVYTKNVGPESLATVLSWCVIPFIIPDIIKIALALVIGERLRKVINKMN